MESLAKKPFVVNLKLPLDLYTFIENNPAAGGTITLNESSLELTLKTETESGPTIYTSSLYFAESLYCFSVDTRKLPHFKGPIKFSGTLLPSSSNFPPPLLALKKPSIVLSDSLKENQDPKTFKLHKNHSIFLSSNVDNAIEREAKKRFGEMRKRAPEIQVIKSLKSLFEVQKFWKIKMLAEETVQPEAFIREIMKKIGKKATTGECRGLWTLADDN